MEKAHTETIKPDRYIRWKELEKIVPLCRMTVWRMCREGKFPLPIRISTSATAWNLREVEEFLASRKKIGGPNQ